MKKYKFYQLTWDDGYCTSEFNGIIDENYGDRPYDVTQYGGVDCLTDEDITILKLKIPGLIVKEYHNPGNLLLPAWTNYDEEYSN